MYFNVIDSHRKVVLEKVLDSVSIKDYYMAGGTALALQTGHRFSYDFDFFVRESFNIDKLLSELAPIRKSRSSLCQGSNYSLYYR